MPKNKGGRPTKMTETTLGKLEHAFSCGMSDREACLYADVHPSTLYDYCHKHPEFSDRKELLKHTLAIRAKKVIAEELEHGNAKIAMWYLERKCKDEFSLRQETAFSDLPPVVIVEDVPKEG